MLIPREAFDKTGGFDSDFFMYSEELDLCHRIRKQGYSIQYTDEVHVIHKHGGSTTDGQWSLRQKYVSNLLLYKKKKGAFGYLLYHFLFCLNSFSNFFAMWLLDKNYRRDFWKLQRIYMFSLRYFFTILFRYGQRSSEHFIKVPIGK